MGSMNGPARHVTTRCVMQEATMVTPTERLKRPRVYNPAAHGGQFGATTGGQVTILHAITNLA